MGIRYYAYPVAAELVEIAASSPRDFMSADPLADAWGPPDQRPPMLYLDKCWRNLQVVLGASRSEEIRPAYELVRGEVTMHSDGWVPYLRYLDPQKVRDIAADIANVDECQVMDGVAAIGGQLLMKDFASEVDYTIDYLSAAIAFTADSARAGQGLVYMIG